MTTVGFILGAVLALVSVIFKASQNEQATTVVKPKHSTMRADEKVCPYCAETIKAAAIKCRHCQSGLD